MTTASEGPGRSEDEDSFENYVLRFYEETYHYPCFGDWPPTPSSIGDRAGLHPKTVRSALAKLDASGALESARRRCPTAPVRDPASIPIEVMFRACTHRLLALCGEANLKAIDRQILLHWWGSPAVDAVEPTPAELGRLAGVGARRAQQGLKTLEEAGLFSPLMFPTADGLVALPRGIP